MSRETLKAKVIEVLKEVEVKQIDYIVQHNVCEHLADAVIDDGAISERIYFVSTWPSSTSKNFSKIMSTIHS